MITMQDNRNTAWLVMMGVYAGVATYTTTATRIGENLNGDILYIAQPGDTVTIHFNDDALDPGVRVYDGNAAIANMLWSTVGMTSQTITIPIPANVAAATIEITE